MENFLATYRETENAGGKAGELLRGADATFRKAFGEAARTTSADCYSRVHEEQRLPPAEKGQLRKTRAALERDLDKLYDLETDEAGGKGRGQASEIDDMKSMTATLFDAVYGMLRPLADTEQETFYECLRRLRKERGMTKDSELYNKAHVNTAMDEAIRNKRCRQVGKSITLAYAMALELDKRGVNLLLAKAGLRSLDNSPEDKIILKHIEEKRYDIGEINEDLYNDWEKRGGKGKPLTLGSKLREKN
jgi:hypothetical protein